MVAMTMDLHLLIVIGCVFLASLSSLLFINRFFKRKTFEEVIAEQRALNERLYSRDRNLLRRKDQSKKQLVKKELKRAKRQLRKEQQQQQQQQHQQQQDNDDVLPGREEEEEEEYEQQQSSTESSRHVPIAPETSDSSTSMKSSSQNQTLANQQQSNHEFTTNNTSEKDNVSVSSGKGTLKNAGKKEKKAVKNESQQSGSVNQIEASGIGAPESNVQEPVSVPALPLKVKKEEQQQQQKDVLKKINLTGGGPVVKKTDQNSFAIMEEDNELLNINGTGSMAIKVLEPKDEKQQQRYNSPKSGNGKQQKQSQSKKQQKDNNMAKGIGGGGVGGGSMALLGEQLLNGKETVSVSLLMNLFRRSELNRSEIQVLIDYLLNLQQDTPTNHAEWSDDVCQKLKRQLKEAENALAEEQEASLGIQAKLRELRAEVNAERITMSANVKNYIEKIQSKEQDLMIMEQKVKSLNEAMNLERQQFQAKLIQEKQATSQDLLAQLQMMQNELTHKDKCIGELTHMVNASHQSMEKSQQKDEIIQKQVQQLRALEQQRDELEQLSNSRLFELEKSKQLENELSEANVEIRNLQNAIDTNKTEANQTRLEMEALSNELAAVRKQALAEKQQETELLQSTNNDLQQKVYSLTAKMQDQSKELGELQSTVKSQQQQLHDKEQQLSELMTTRNRMQQELLSAQNQKREQDAHQQEMQSLVVRLREEVDVSAQQLHDSQTLIDNLNHELEQQRQTLRENAAQARDNNELQSRMQLLQEQQWEKDQRIRELEEELEPLKREHLELTNQLQEQKDKNNELRKKNWRLVEALDSKTTDNRHDNRNLQNRFEAQTPNDGKQGSVVVSVKPGSETHHQDGGLALLEGGNVSKEQLEEKYLKQLCARLYPEAMKKLPAVDSSNLDDWMERVLNVIIEQELQKQQLVSKDNNENTKQNNINSNKDTDTSGTEGQATTTNSHHNNSNSNTLDRTEESVASETSSNSQQQLNNSNSSNNSSNCNLDNTSSSSSSAVEQREQQQQQQFSSVGDRAVDQQQQQCLHTGLGQEEELNSPAALTQSNGEKDI